MRRGALPAACLALAASAAGLAPASAPAVPPPPALSAPQAMLVQPQTGDVLYRRNVDVRRPVASTTKLMTALLVLERVSLDDVFTAVPYSAAAAESRINLRTGERMTVRDLLRALLLESANDAAATLAVGTSGSLEAFVAAMNARARRLGLSQTSYANPIGLDDPRNHSSAADLVKLTRRLQANPFFRATVARRAIRIISGARPRVLENTNEIVGRDGVNGVKTGHTLGAGYVLVGSASRRGVGMVSVVLGDPSEDARDADTLALLRWGFSQYRRVPIVRTDRVVARARVRYRDEDRIELVPARSVVRILRSGERPAVTLSAPEALEGPMPRGAAAGLLTVRLRGRVVARMPLVTAQPVPEVSILERAADRLLKPATLALILVVAAGCALIGLVVMRRRARESVPSP